MTVPLYRRVVVACALHATERQRRRWSPRPSLKAQNQLAPNPAPIRARVGHYSQTHELTLLDEAVAALRRLPPATQDAYARLLLDALPAHGTAYALSADHRASVRHSKAKAARGEFAPEDEIYAWGRRFGP